MAEIILIGGKLVLVGGMYLTGTPATDTVSNTLSVTLTPWQKVNLDGHASRFNIQTTAASDDTTANVPIIGSFTGDAPRPLYARVVDSNGNALPGSDWTDITSTVTVSGSTFLGYLNGVRADIGCRRQIRHADSDTVIDLDAVSFNIGCNALPWGQSNMRGTLDGDYSRDTTIPGAAQTELAYFNANGTGAYFGPDGAMPGGHNSKSIGSYNLVWGGGLALLRLLGTTLQNKIGRKVGIGLNPWALNGTAMSGFMNSSGVIAMLSNSGTTSGSIGLSSPAQFISGDYRVVAWHQGESEPEGASLTRAKRLGDLIKFCQAHIAQVAKFGRPANKLTFLFAFMGVGSPPHMEVLRGAVLDLIEHVQVNNLGWDVRIGWNCIDLDPQTVSDTLHFGGLDQKRSLYRMAQAMRNVLDPAAVPYGARGPKLTGAYARSGDDVTLTVEQDGGMALVAKNSGAAITGWYAHTRADFDDALGSAIALTNVMILSSTQVRVTATGAPATFYIKHCGGKVGTAQSNTPNVSNLIYDDFAYPTGADAGEQFIGLPLLPTPDAIEVT